jgi:hypothetical protein
MRNCTRCGKPAPLWGIDLTTGICGDCRKDDREAEHRRRQEEEERYKAAAMELQHTQEQIQQKKIDALHGRCLECGGSFKPIRLFGRGAPNPLSGAAVDTELLYYTDEDAGRSMMFAMFAESGYVRAAICSSCRRIVLRGEPKT